MLVNEFAVKTYLIFQKYLYAFEDIEYNAEI